MNLSDELIQWYLKNKRDLPWRGTTNAYVIWLSEIILQQTRVEQGMPYFHCFLEKYPDIKAFAAADEDEILNLWQGLGYYSRGRNMLKTAREIVAEYGGEFPTEYEQLIRLKGIGEYTASAISSFSANQAKAVVDGNVFRVLARYFGISEPINSTRGKKLFQDAANDILNKENPGLHNQAMMEFGAMLCKPKNPDCAICPVRSGCYANHNNVITELPQKLKTVKIRERFLNYIVVTDGDTILMNKRDEKDIWANMYDFPLFETSHRLTAEEVLQLPEFKSHFGENNLIIDTYPIKKHVLTHQHLHAQFIHISNKPIKLEQKWFYIDVNILENIAMPKIIFIFINNLFNL
ncbi:MAG: A/G-specific adenine glycosylase [Bacteroidetes bacterium]|jgi:A/G-specific adenine glycosylase|nr:A/G-specific adenine glycosylase [Bacteroidota bacterium]